MLCLRHSQLAVAQKLLNFKRQIQQSEVAPHRPRRHAHRFADPLVQLALSNRAGGIGHKAVAQALE